MIQIGRNEISKKRNYLSYDVLDMVELEQALTRTRKSSSRVPVTEIVTVTHISSSSLPMKESVSHQAPKVMFVPQSTYSQVFLNKT